MSTVKKSHAVYGYVRTNYDHNVPESIIRMCLNYFDQNIVIRFQGNKLKEFLSKQNEEYYKYKFKFNQQVSFTIYIAPNGFGSHTKGWVVVRLKVNSIPDTVDHVRMSFNHHCVDTSTICVLQRGMRGTHQRSAIAHPVTSLSQCHDSKQ